MIASYNPDLHKCSICGKLSGNCACYDLCGNGVIYFCPHCLMYSTSPEAEYARTFGKPVRIRKK